jgi:hypothetical protein
MDEKVCKSTNYITKKERFVDFYLLPENKIDFYNNINY